jgi:flagellar basal body-associated protein FliL
MLGKMLIGLIAVAIVTVAPTMSASAEQKPAQQKKIAVNIPKKPAQQKKITVNIPKQVCETLTVDTENWGE